uniref:sensor histidine kinase n=1 Tax=Streptomyces sp. NBC_01001 TaxID=2903713 RepID=UPI003BAB83F5
MLAGRQVRRQISPAGSGLALSIVGKFVEACGGTVTVDSEAGAGVVFTIRLPFQLQPGCLPP